MANPPSARPTRLRLLGFATGDFAFNLYWQSVMLYLLFYYTEALGLSVGTASLIYLIASVWDGIVNFAAGVLTDRHRQHRRDRLALVAGAVPLGLAFMLAYLPLPVGDAWGAAAVLAGHMVFRTAYAFLNVPYLAMSARISHASGDRAYLAVARMLFGTAASVCVALSTVPIGRWLSTDGGSAWIYLPAAALFATVGSILIIWVGATYREEPWEQDGRPADLRASLASLAANRAFVTLNLAMVAMIVGVTVLNKSVLYYFKYFVGDEAAGQLALAAMGLVSAVALPAWMLLSRRFGVRDLWFAAVAVSVLALAVFWQMGDGRAAAMQGVLVAMQVGAVGLHFVFWALLPDTIEYGERATGLRVEGIVFGVAALLQRVAIGIATAILGLGFGTAGYVANTAQSVDTLAGMRLTLALVPVAFLLLSAVIMAFNPLTRGTHDRIVRDLAGD